MSILAVSTLGLLLLWWEVGGPPWRLSPDGQFYLTPDPPRPYGGRFLLPWLLRTHLYLWIGMSYGALWLTAMGVGWLGGWVASALFLGLASTRTNAMFPILTDQVGMLLLLLSVVTPWPWNVIPVIVGAAVNEKVPLFAAPLTGDPRLILALGISWLFWRRSRKPNETDPEWIKAPLTEARKKSHDLDWKTLILPWGVALPGIFLLPPLAVALAYLQVLIAQDRARLMQWISPLAVIVVAPLIPEGWAVPLLVAHWANPWRRVL